MSRKKKRRPGKVAGPSEARAEAAEQLKMEEESAGREAAAPITQYIFTFELIRHYPTVRSFIVKQPLKRSFKDTMSELFGGNKKGVYRI